MELKKLDADRANGALKLAQKTQTAATNPYVTKTAEIKDFITDKNVKLVDDYLKKLDWQVKENSNMTYSIQGLNNYISSAISKNYWLNKIYTPQIKQAHENGDIHINTQESGKAILYNMSGICLQDFHLQTGKNILNPIVKQSGIYLLKIYTNLYSNSYKIIIK